MAVRYLRGILKVWHMLLDRFIHPLVCRLSRTELNSWKEHKQQVLFYCLKKIPDNWFAGEQVSDEFVETIYDKVSGSYVKQLAKGGRKKWSIINGEIVKMDTIESRRIIRKEMWDYISRHSFESILEVGAGELRTISLAGNIFTEEKLYYGIDLSLNRLCHGYKQFCIKNDFKIKLAKANAIYLPFADKSIDTVYSTHCLELMPKNHFKKAVTEMCRVARNHVFLFEPSWELGGCLQKMKMASERYVRGIPKFITADLGLKLTDYRLLTNHFNPFNKTALHHITLENNTSKQNLSDFVCPICHGSFDRTKSYLICKECDSLYFTYEDIFILDPAYRHKVTCFLHDF
jgi:ubiquinone/menaquinone biosynthesis C-methylase UbiE